MQVQGAVQLCQDWYEDQDVLLLVCPSPTLKV